MLAPPRGPPHAPLGPPNQTDFESNFFVANSCCERVCSGDAMPPCKRSAAGAAVGLEALRGGGGKKSPMVLDGFILESVTSACVHVLQKPRFRCFFAHLRWVARCCFTYRMAACVKSITIVTAVHRADTPPISKPSSNEHLLSSRLSDWARCFWWGSWGWRGGASKGCSGRNSQRQQ